MMMRQWSLTMMKGRRNKRRQVESSATTTPFSSSYTLPRAPQNHTTPHKKETKRLSYIWIERQNRKRFFKQHTRVSRRRAAVLCLAYGSFVGTTRPWETREVACWRQGVAGELRWRGIDYRSLSTKPLNWLSPGFLER